MSEHRPPGLPAAPDHEHADPQSPGTGHGAGHRWMMVLCCIPMIAIAVWLVMAGVAGAGAVLIALVCLGLMALMMVGMGHGSGHR
ncbi:hypothetical protein HJG43_06830 [Kineosporiaceae bacterium SCSIO 59966]|nr:hypothetical protein HJG43_06830 [Kineosporiaceae bacterium SCSIO 59966]